MSYCRFFNSDVYLFEHVGGYAECCGCSLRDNPEFDTPLLALDHLLEHIEAGDYVPDYAIERLKVEVETGYKYTPYEARGEGEGDRDG